MSHRAYFWGEGGGGCGSLPKTTNRNSSPIITCLQSSSWKSVSHSHTTFSFKDFISLPQSCRPCHWFKNTGGGGGCHSLDPSTRNGSIKQSLDQSLAFHPSWKHLNRLKTRAAVCRYDFFLRTIKYWKERIWNGTDGVTLLHSYIKNVANFPPTMKSGHL